MSEVGGGLEDLMMGGAVSEGNEMSDEQFNEEMRKTQAAVKQLQKEEGHAKQQDSDLAGIIVQFLGQPENTGLFLLISRVIAQNIPSELIIAIIALIDDAATAQVEAYLQAGNVDPGQALQKQADFGSLPPEHKEVIDQWIRNLDTVAASKPHRTLETIVIRTPEPSLSSQLIQLSAFILKRYLDKFNIDNDIDHLKEFMQSVFLEIVKHVEDLVQGQKSLEGSE